MMPMPAPMTSWKPTDLERLLSACNVVSKPAPTMVSTQPAYVGIMYLPVFLTAMPAIIAMRLMLYDSPKRSTPAPVGDLSLHASKNTAYQSTGGHRHQLTMCRQTLLRTTQGCQDHSHDKILEIAAGASPIHAQQDGDLEQMVNSRHDLSLSARGLTTGGLQK
jgi:hypothetical protein